MASDIPCRKGDEDLSSHLEIQINYCADSKLYPNGRSACAVVLDHGVIPQIVKAVNCHDELLAALEVAEMFISGFEDDETQENIADLLDGVRKAIAKAKGV